MATSSTDTSGLSLGTVGSGKALEPSLGNALPHFFPLVVFPLAMAAAMHGGWWIAGPFVFLFLPDMFDGVFGMETRNMDPDKTDDRQLLAYDLAVWMWALLWPATLLFGLWQILVVGHLALWEAVLVALALTGVAQSVFLVGHELAHRSAAWERALSEFLLTSVAYPHYALEHLYGHHANACTPADPGSAPKGLSFWRYFPRDMIRGYANAWHFSCTRLERRHLPVWHYTNPFWRYGLGVGAWFALVYWMGGAWALLIFAYLCVSVAVSLKTINYAQHYGLQRVRLPGGRFEPVQPWHSWSFASRLSNWLFYNIQRHADHHISATRHYPLLQHRSEDESPQLPGSYVKMAFLVMAPKRWFRTMDPLVDRWRTQFYPHIKDWSAYDSRAFAARPNAFEAIEEILGTAPRLGAWINRAPMLLDNLQKKEFTDLDLPDGFGPDAATEAAARRGLVRLYWTREFGVAEMSERIADFPIHSPRDAVEAARHWSNDQVFQVGLHTMRGNLSPAEAGIALANAAEAAVATVLEAVEDAYARRHAVRGTGSIAVAALGDVASSEAAPGTGLDVVFVYDGGPAEYYEALGKRCHEELRALTHDSLLFAPLPRRRHKRNTHALADLASYHQTAGLTGELLDLTRTRRIFTSGDAGIEQRVAEARREALRHGAVRDALLAELRAAPANASGPPEPGLQSVRDMRGGLQDVERAARWLQLAHADEFPDMPTAGAAAVFQTAAAQKLAPHDVAERLADAARMWRSLQGIMALVAQDDFAAETATPQTKAAIARASGMPSFAALDDAIRDTASRTAADIRMLLA